MHKPSPSRIGMIMTIAAAMGITNLSQVSPAQILDKQRGKRKKGTRWKSSSVYWPAGVHCNVEPTPVRNPKVRAHVQMMHEKWAKARADRFAEKLEKNRLAKEEYERDHEERVPL